MVGLRRGHCGRSRAGSALFDRVVKEEKAAEGPVCSSRGLSTTTARGRNITVSLRCRSTSSNVDVYAISSQPLFCEVLHELKLFTLCLFVPTPCSLRARYTSTAVFTDFSASKGHNSISYCCCLIKMTFFSADATGGEQQKQQPTRSTAMWKLERPFQPTSEMRLPQEWTY